MVKEMATRLLLPRRSFIEITVPEPPTPARVRTAASFMVISAVGDRFNSAFTSESDMVPTGVVILYP
jgi:hypothetical protein